MILMKRVVPGILLALAFFIVGIATLPHYGMHEDNPFHFLRGQYYLERILGRDGRFDLTPLRSPVLFMPGQRISSYKLNASEELFSPKLPISGADAEKTVQQEYKEMIDLLGKRSSFYKHNAWGGNIWDITDNQGHPAISDMLMAATNRTLFEFLGWFGDIEAYHFYVIGVVGVSLLFLYLFVADAFGSFAAGIAALALALYPMVFAESHMNIKDPVQMGYFTIAVVSAYFTAVRKHWLDWFVLLLLSVFLALGTKWNIVFLPLILAPWIVVVYKKSDIGQSIGWKRMIVLGLIAVIAPLILLLLAYPFYWTQTVFKLLNTFDFYATLGVKDLSIQQATYAPLPGGFDARAILQIFSMSPPVMLVLAAIGVIGVIVRKVPGKHSAGLLVLLWLVVPLLRVIWQTSEFYGSMRNFMEFLPALAVLVGIGSAWIVRKMPRVIGGAFLLIFILMHVYILVRWHPYEHIYFNGLFGGLKGAEAKGLYTWETLYDAPYRELANWLNTNADKGARLAYLDGTMLALSPLWLRDDIRFGSYFSGLDAGGEYIASIVYPKPPAVFPINYLESFVEPVYKVVVDGVVVAKIWKNDKTHTLYGGHRRVVGVNDLVVRSEIASGAQRSDTLLPSPFRILSATVEVSDIRCITVRSLVWGTLKDGKVSYIVPWISPISDTRATVSFPGVYGNGIRWWDREKAGCKSVNVLEIEGIE